MKFLTELMATVAAITAISTFLTILIMIANATIANYGEVQITVNKKKIFTVQGGKPLLATLAEQQLFIPSACGGRGSCGLCKVKVLEGGGQVLPTELPWLSREEIENSVRLSCQLKVKQDFSIQIPDELFSVRQYKGVVSGIRDLTHDIKEIKVTFDGSSELSFQAGQFIQIQVPEYELSDESVYRAYSIASSPSDKKTIELEIRLVPDGICTTWIHKYLKEGDAITLNGPYGEFYLRDSQRDIVCIAGGSGMAPIKAILSYMNEQKINRNTRYFFGARTASDLFLLDEMKQLEKEMASFRFIPSLSAPEKEDDWKGETGLVTEILDRHLKDGKNTEAYLCGSPGMIDACMRVLKDKGVPEDLIFYDKFA